MPRPRKCRKICHLPRNTGFSPLEESANERKVILDLEEYECIRLIDHLSMSQEECAAFMGIGRTTVQSIYGTARAKLALALVEGLPFSIEGGDYRLCDGSEGTCVFGGCFKQEFNKKYDITKGSKTMRIAVTYENGQVFQHFGRTEAFKIYDIEDGKIITAQVVSTNGSGHSALAGVLTALKADALICGGIGGGAQAALAAAGIKLYGGVSGEADKAVQAFVENKLLYQPDIKCDHHGHHHGHDHECGEHGCGSHEGGCGEHHCH